MKQQEFDMKSVDSKAVVNVADFRFAPIKGQPMLHWRGKRPFVTTSYFPAQEKEQHGEEVNGWHNTPFDSKAGFKKSLTCPTPKVEVPIRSRSSREKVIVLY